MSNLDRTPNGITRKCDECSRTFKGEGWQDYCAECHAKVEKNSPLRSLWACLTCNSKFPFGEIRPGAGALVSDQLPCPRCGNRTITPADSQVRETAEYYGEVPPIAQRS